MLYWLPQAVTFTGIFFGLLSITWAPHHPHASGVAILVACACDLMDGRVARWTGTESAFGLQMDSLADIINCGVAPAFLVHCWSLHGGMLGRFDLYLLVAFFLLPVRRDGWHDSTWTSGKTSTKTAILRIKTPPHRRLPNLTSRPSNFRVFQPPSERCCFAPLSWPIKRRASHF